jgi:hypothetical protein
MDMNQFGMMPMPQMMGMDPSSNMNLYGGNMTEMPSMGMNLFSGMHPGMTPNQMLGGQGQFQNPQQGEFNDNTSQ